MDCFQDFCLFCDRDSPDGPYCSQRCKLADVERSNPSSPTAPQSAAERNWASSRYHHQYQHTPSYNAPASASRPPSSYFLWPAAHQQSEQADERQLTPSSSRTSLSSTTSNLSTSGGYSREARAQLNEYFSALDAAKAAKRRSSVR